MKARLNYYEKAPKLGQKLMELSQACHETSLDTSLFDIVQLRASQLNGCTFCVDMHSKEAKIHGERELRLYHVPVWRESPLFSEKERAALLFTEELTSLTFKGISDDIYAAVREHFSESEVVELTYVINIINFWNRLSVTFRSVPGSLDKMYGLDKANL
jgi:AhpD family alkylhydroperoxidase